MADSTDQPRSDAARGVGVLDWRKLHLWQIQPVRDILVVLLVVALIYVGYLVRIVTVPLLLALLLAYLFEPVVSAMTRKGRMSRRGAVASILVAVVVLIVVPATIAAGFAAIQVLSAATTVATNADDLLNSIRAETPEERLVAYEKLDGEGWRNVSRFLSELQPTPEQPAPAPGSAVPPTSETTPNADNAISPVLGLSDENRVKLLHVAGIGLQWLKDNLPLITKRVVGSGADAVGVAFRAVGSVGYIGFTLFLTGFFFFFVSTSYGRVLEFWQDLIPERKKGMTIDLASKMNVAVSGFVRGRLTIAAIQSVLFSLGYLLIGVPGWIILGPVVAVLSIVPYAALIGVPVSIVLLYLETNSIAFQDTIWWTLAAPIAIYMAGQAMDDYVLTPAIQGKSTGMDTPTILFASLAGGALAGVYGLLIAIPVAACIKILMSELFWPRFKRWAQGKERDFLPISN